MNVRNFTLAAVAALSLVAVATPSPAFAQGKMTGKMDHKMGGKMMGGVYVVKETKMAYSPSQAKMMGMKDKSGHKMMMMKTMPAGYKMAKMDKMGGGKMMGGKMMGGKPAGGM